MLGYGSPTPPARLEHDHEAGGRRACSLIGAAGHPCTISAAARATPGGAWRSARPPGRFGHRRPHVILRREEHVPNGKRIRRLYRGDGLMVRRRRSRECGLDIQAPLMTEASARRPVFIQDQLADGR